ncbi:MAG TPA: TonB-dependent receptor, partial [Candidatus Didemnitutus sp.]|nr:TonB-dependent receptor [Candidatus Didemnitutus sp.]
TLVLIDGQAVPNQLGPNAPSPMGFGNINAIPLEAIERIEVLRDGAGIIYGSSAIGGAVNIILKKRFDGFAVDFMGGQSTHSPGERETFQASFGAGAETDKTTIVVTGSYFKNHTIYAADRPNSAQSDNRPRGGTNTGSPTFPGVIAVGGGGTPRVLRPDFPANATPTPADYIPMDTNGFSSNQLFNFRQYSPSAPGQERNSLQFGIEHKIIDRSLVFFGNYLYTKLTTSNGLAPAPFALDAEPEGPAVGSLTSFGPYNQGILGFNNGDFFRYRSIELGNRTNKQQFSDQRYLAGLRGDVGSTSWKWEVSYVVDHEAANQLDAGVPSLPLLDAQVASGAFNPFAPGFSKGSATIGGVTYTWDNEKALKATEITARQVFDTKFTTWSARASGNLFALPAGDVALAAGYETRSGSAKTDVDDLYSSGSVLGLNTLNDDYNEAESKSIYAELRVPILSAANKVAGVHDLSIGGLARKEDQTIKGTNRATAQFESRDFDKVNPSINLQYSPTEKYKFRGTWSKGFLAPSAPNVFGSPVQSNPTLADPLGFPTNPQTTIVIRGNPNLQPAESKAWSTGLVAQPWKNFSLTVDYYDIKTDGIIANNAKAILFANAAGQGAGFVPGNPATINPNAPFAAQIKRSANGRLNSNGNFGGGLPRGAVLSDFLNIASREATGIEYTATYTQPTDNWGRFTFTAAANQFLKFDQTNAPGLPTQSYLGKFVSTVGDAISPGSIPVWKGTFSTRWNWKQWMAMATINYIDSYQDDPLFVLSPKMLQYYKAGTPITDPAFAAFLADPSQPKVGGVRDVSAWTTLDLQ